MEKNMKKKYIYLNHFAVQQKLTKHCKSTILQQNKFFKNLFRKSIAFQLLFSKIIRGLKS